MSRPNADRHIVSIVALVVFALFLSGISLFSYDRMGAETSEVRQADRLTRAAREAEFALRAEQRAYEDAALFGSPFEPNPLFEAAVGTLAADGGPSERASIAAITAQIEQFDQMGRKAVREYRNGTQAGQNALRLLDTTAETISGRLSALKGLGDGRHSRAVAALEATRQAFQNATAIAAGFLLLFGGMLLWFTSREASAAVGEDSGADERIAA